MANIEPPPPAPAPSIIPDDTTSTAPKASMGDAASPADSEKTVVARPRTRPRKMVAQPGTGAAVFSTDGGRLSHRRVPCPPPPVIVRSGKVQGVLESANYWRKKCPEFFHCFFPDQGWTITDLWDDYDIHLESPGFLEEVLGFITGDNNALASKFGWDWGLRNREMGTGKVDTLSGLSGNDSHLMDSNDPLSLVEAFFTEHELGDWPREFLYHALFLYKQSMRSYMSKYHPAPTEGSATPLGNTEPSSAMVDEHAATTYFKQQPPVTARPRNTSLLPLTYPYTDALLESTFAEQPFIGPGSVSSVPNGPQVRHPSFTPSQPPRPILHQGDGVPIAHSSSMMPGNNGGQPRHSKRPGRSGSNSFAQPPQMYGYGENVRIPSAGHMYHPPGPPPNGGPHQYVPNMPMGPSMVNSLQPGAHFPPNAAMTSPPMHPGQMQYTPVMAPAIFPLPGSVPPQIHEPAYQHYGPNVPGPRVGPFVDMANNIQYPPVRGIDARGMPRRNSQNMNSSGLYNPYGAERPDKAGFATTGARRGGRGNFPNNVGRGRKHSIGTFDRSGYIPYTPDHPDNGLRSNSGPYAKGPQTRDTNYSFEPDPNITKDKESGCDTKFIGPKNTLVRQLFVRNLPDGITGPEIVDFFSDHTKVTPTGAEVKFSGDRKEFVHAFVSFKSTEHARKALEANIPPVRGKQVHVSVARRYFQLGANSRALTQDPHRSANSTSVPEKPNPYSPQDARSDLHGVNTQQQPETPAMRGSPEVRKAKKNMSGKKSPAERNDRMDDGLEVESTSTKPTPTPGADDSTEKQETLVHDKNQDARKTVAIAETVVAKSESVVEEAPYKPPTVETVAEKEVEGASDVHEVPLNKSGPASPDTITESIPTDAHAPLLSSPTKVALPPSTEKVQKSMQEKPSTIGSIEPEEAEQIAAAPPAQEEALSDDDQKNDLSFHSAQESQPDFGAEESKKYEELGEAHVENEVAEVKATEDTQREIHQPELETPQQDQITRITDILTPKGQEEKDVAPAAGKSPAEAGKKQGVKQTESLNPYSKASKAQMKKLKEKEKKKEKLKEKEKKKGNTEVAGKEETLGEEQVTIVKDIEGEKYLKIVSSSVHEESPAQGYRNNQFQAQQSVEVQKTEQVISDQPGGSPTPVQSHEKANPEANLTATITAPFLRVAGLQNDQNQLQEPEKKIKPIPAKIAVPSLELLKRKSSPTSATTPPNTAYFSATSPSSGKASVAGAVGAVGETAELQQNGEAPSASSALYDAASVASSTTLRGPSPPPMSLSPTAKDFHTPLQTPKALGTPLTEAAKKKKKKKSKKKPTNTEGMSGQEAEEPFHDQLSQVNTQTGYYSLRGNDLPAQEVFGRKEDKGPKSLIRQVQAYVKEKTSGYARVPESTWSKDNRKQMEKNTPAESEEILIGARLPVTRTMAHYCHNAMLPEASPGKAGKAGKVPHFGE